MLIIGLVLYLVMTKLGLNTIAEGSFLYGNGLLLYNKGHFCKLYFICSEK